VRLGEGRPLEVHHITDAISLVARGIVVISPSLQPPIRRLLLRRNIYSSIFPTTKIATTSQGSGDTYDLNPCILPHKFGNLPDGQILWHNHFQSFSLSAWNNDRFLTSRFFCPSLRQLRAVHPFEAVEGEFAGGGTVEEGIVGVLVGEYVVCVAEVEGGVVYVYVAAF